MCCFLPQGVSILVEAMFQKQQIDSLLLRNEFDLTCVDSSDCRVVAVLNVHRSCFWFLSALVSSGFDR
jgi:hypothetical protein